MAELRGTMVLLALLCASVPASAGETPEETVKAASALQAVEQLFEAFNRHDPQAMADQVTEDFELFYVQNGVATRDVTGPDALAKSMTGYFASLPTVRSEIVEAIDGPTFVSVRERAIWTREGKEFSQTSIAVYEVRGSHVRDGKIARVWYYPAE